MPEAPPNNHLTRSPDQLFTANMPPASMLLLFRYMFGGARSPVTAGCRSPTRPRGDSTRHTDLPPQVHPRGRKPASGALPTSHRHPYGNSAIGLAQLV